VLREIRLQIKDTNECMARVTNYIDGLSSEVAGTNQQLEDLRKQMGLMEDRLLTVLEALVGTLCGLENRLVGRKNTTRRLATRRDHGRPRLRTGDSRPRRA
jgi:hypothetical protein